MPTICAGSELSVKLPDFPTDVTNNDVPWWRVDSESIITPGKGYSKDTEQVSLGKCFNVSTTPVSTIGMVNATTSMTYDELTNTYITHEVKKKNYFLFSSRDERYYTKSIQDSETSLSLNFAHVAKRNLEVDLEGFGIDALNKFGRGVYEQQYDRFGVICGDSYYSGIVEGALLLSAVNIKFDSRVEKEKFVAHGGKGAFFNIFSATKEVQNIIARNNIKGTIEIQVYQKGGNPAELSKVLTKDPSGRYYSLSCDMKTYQDCVKAAGGVLDYAQDIFPAQVDLDSGKGLSLLGAIEALPVSVAGLEVPETLLTPAVEEAQKFLKKNHRYAEELPSLISEYPVAWEKDNDFYREREKFLKHAEDNLDLLDKKSKGCFNTLFECSDIKDQVNSRLYIIDPEEVEFFSIKDLYDNSPVDSSGYLSKYLNQRGDYYYHSNSHTKAIRSYTEALKQNDGWAEGNRSLIYYNRSQSYHMIEDYKREIEDCSKALEQNDEWINSMRSSIYYARARSHDKLKNYDKAIEDYNKALECEDLWSKFRHSLISKSLQETKLKIK